MTVKWGIIGCGAVAEHKGGPALYNAPDSELIAVMRRDEQLAAEFAQRHGAKRHYSSVEAILADDEINAVYIATPPHVHAEQTIAAADAGKHVLCEKPMAMNVGQGREMIAACRNNGVQLMIAYYRRFWPLASKMQQLIADGAIGWPTMAYAHCAALWQPPEDPSTFWRIQRDIAAGQFEGIKKDNNPPLPVHHRHRLQVLSQSWFFHAILPLGVSKINFLDRASLISASHIRRQEPGQGIPYPLGKGPGVHLFQCHPP